MSNDIKVLRNSNEIRRAIWELFAEPTTRRIALVAYVGADAQDYLPNPSGIELICWDKEGCTNPDAVRDLRNLKVKVSFSQNLHMKIFWAENRGVIIGSANLSNNGLSDYGLQEMAVLLPANAIDIQEVKSQVNAVQVTSLSLQDLDKRTLQYRSRNLGKEAYPTVAHKSEHKQELMTFADWYKTEYPKAWRLFVYDDNITGLTREAEQKLKSLGYKTSTDYWTGAKCHANCHEWILSVDANKNGDGVNWSNADFSVAIKPNDKEFYDKNEPFFSVQIHPISKYGKPPFQKDRAFNTALRRLLSQAKVETYMDGLRFAPNGVLEQKNMKRLYESYLEESGRK